MNTFPLDHASQATSISGPPTSWDYLADRTFRSLAQAGVWLILALLAFILWSIGGKAWVAVRDHGLSFLTSTAWDVGRQQFAGALELACRGRDAHRWRAGLDAEAGSGGRRPDPDDVRRRVKGPFARSGPPCYHPPVIEKKVQ